MTYKTTISTAIVLALTLFTCKRPVKETVLVIPEKDYKRATASAMKLINGFVGCDLLTHGTGNSMITVRGNDGEPCGDINGEVITEDQAGAAYSCGYNRYDIMISRPGTSDIQVCIIAHEIGHALGLEHSTIGIMANCDPGKRLIVRDKDVKVLHKRYCQ